MCCLFGFYNYSGNEIEDISKLTNILAKNAADRGTDATGIAYNHNNRLSTYKQPKSAYQIDFKHPNNIICLSGHTRHATQGDNKKNYNNHPFMGDCKNTKFALSHNGVLINDAELKRKFKLPKTKIQTDSYIAVQLLESKNKLDADSIKFMAENVHGSFAFTILDSTDNLWLVRGDSPLSLVHLPNYKLYVYASTNEILYKSLVETKLFDEIKRGNFGEINITSGSIAKITSDGNILTDRFDYNEYGYMYNCNWWDYDISDKNSTYVDELKAFASYQGISAEDIDELLNNGFSLDEVEEYIYQMV